MKCRSCASGNPASKPNPGSKREPQKGTHPPRPPAAEGWPPVAAWFDETSDFLACPWPLPSLHSSAVPLSSRALPPGSNSFLPLSQTEANRMRGQDFGIHQCLRKTLAWSPCISCQSCQQPHRRSSLGARLGGSCPPAARARRAARRCQPVPPRRCQPCQPAPPGPHPPRFTKINTIPAVS